MPDNPASTAGVAFLAALARCGLRAAVVCPGSRNTPLLLAAHRHAEVDTVLVHDERSAGLVALGRAAAAGMRTAFITRSGTAAAELLPAMAEADAAGVPLIACTADRPASLRGRGAPQTIDQVNLYGSRARLYAEPEDAAAAMAAAVAAWEAATAPSAGPVHINLPFAEPLVGEPGALPPSRQPAGRDRDPVESLPAGLVSGRRCLIVVGPNHHHSLATPVAALSTALAAPVVADAASGLRHGGPVVTCGHVLAAAGYLETHPPEVIIRIGGYPTSKPLFTALAGMAATQIGIWPGAVADPDGVVSHIIRADPAGVCTRLAAMVEAGPGGWQDAWMDAETEVRAAVDAAVGGLAFPSEAAVAAAVAAAAPAGTLWAASSMPVRYLELVAGSARARIHANRGANGIDGVISTALGAALHGPATALVGDIAALHDLNALATAAHLEADLVVVVINNDGGGIFELLPQRHLPEFEQLFAAPHGVRFGAVATSVGLETVTAVMPDELTAAVARRPGPRLVEVIADRRRLAGDLDAVGQAAANALG